MIKVLYISGSILCIRFLALCSNCLLVSSSASLSCTQNMKHSNFVNVTIKVISFCLILEVSHELVCFSSLSRLFKCFFYWGIVATSFRSLYCFMLLLDLTFIRYGLFRETIYCTAPVFSDIDGQFSGSGKCISSILQTCNTLALPTDCTDRLRAIVHLL